MRLAPVIPSARMVAFEPMTGQEVVRPDGSIHQLLRARNVTVMVFEGSERHRVLVKFHALITRRGVFREITSEIELN